MITPRDSSHNSSFRRSHSVSLLSYQLASQCFLFFSDLFPSLQYSTPVTVDQAAIPSPHSQIPFSSSEYLALLLVFITNSFTAFRVAYLCPGLHPATLDGVFPFDEDVYHSCALIDDPLIASDMDNQRNTTISRTVSISEEETKGYHIIYIP